jgi:hypothetical protein
MAFQQIPLDEAVRRIQECDHADAKPLGMTYEHEEAMRRRRIRGIIIPGFDPDTRKLAFMKIGDPPQDGQCRRR